MNELTISKSTISSVALADGTDRITLWPCAGGEIMLNFDRENKLVGSMRVSAEDMEALFKAGLHLVALVEGIRT